MSEIALTYEKVRLHGARCASLSNLEFDQKHLKKEKTALLAVVFSRVNMKITGHFFLFRRIERVRVFKSPCDAGKRCPVSIPLSYHKYQKGVNKNPFLVKFFISNPLYIYLVCNKKGRGLTEPEKSSEFRPPRSK